MLRTLQAGGLGGAEEVHADVPGALEVDVVGLLRPVKTRIGQRVLVAREPRLIGRVALEVEARRPVLGGRGRYEQPPDGRRAPSVRVDDAAVYEIADRLRTLDLDARAA